MNGLNGVAPHSFDEGDEPDSPLEAIWERIENWLVENAPMTLLTLNNGATDKDFWACEAAIGFPLPAEIRESYRIHNGQSEGVLMNDAQFLSLADMASAWHRRTTTEPLAATFSPRWLPLTTDEAGDHFCLDTTEGRVLFFRHDEDAPQVAAASLPQWLLRFADALEAGEYAWSNDYDGLLRRDKMG